MQSNKKKIIRITTVSMSLRWLLKGQLNFIRQYYDVIAISSSGADLDFVEKQGIKTKTIEMTRTITPLKDVIAIMKMYILLKEEKPYIVHTHTPKAGMIGIVAACFARVPHKLHTVAGLPLMESSGFKRKVLEFVEKIIYRFADKVYPNSFGLRDFILQNNLCKQEKLKVIANGSSNGIDTEFFSRTEEVLQKALAIRNEYQLNDIDINLCFIGRIVKDKGINELLEAFEEISKLNKKVKLFLVGAFEDELDSINEKSKHIIKNNSTVIHVGFKDDVRPFLALSDIFVFPSYREGFPNVVMQAGAMSVPCVVTNINGCNEIIKNEENGLIVVPKNVTQLKEAILRLIEEKDFREKLADNSRKMIVDRYEQKYVWDAILKEYQSLENR
ncbi:MAG: glycosyltransferase family 4 protein [Ignavibacteriae bacterium]|nr:glycosyltransferase family 4 protein [Ignavibacteriota bacterium]